MLCRTFGHGCGDSPSCWEPGIREVNIWLLYEHRKDTSSLLDPRVQETVEDLHTFINHSVCVSSLAYTASFCGSGLSWNLVISVDLALA